MRAVVIGGGLAGCAAALELVDGGADVTLYEARPALGGAVQTLPERDGDPSPPTENGQHIALGCFTEYLAFLDRVGERSSYVRRPLDLPVIGADGRVASIRPALHSLLSYVHLPARERLRLMRVLLRLRSVAGERPLDTMTFGELLRELGATPLQVERFWDFLVRSALNLPADEAGAVPGLFTVQTALLGSREASDLILPSRPLGSMHGDAANRALEKSGATVLTGARVESVEDVDGDGVVVALPPAEAAQVLGESPSTLEDSPIVSVHLLFDRRLLRSPLAALLGSDAHWVFDRGALTGNEPKEGQYLTVVSSGVPELMKLRGRELVEHIAAELTGRLGRAELLWSRVSREPRATVALRPGTEQLRRGPQTSRPHVVRAGAWTQTGWPVTMESAVRSGRTAANLLSDMTTRLAA
ncbi:hydroxysqualene dehydroxylase HpnE [soil metagenome]